MESFTIPAAGGRHPADSSAQSPVAVGAEPLYDLLLTDGDFVDPASGRRGRLDVAFAAGRVAAIAPTIAPTLSRQVKRRRGRWQVTQSYATLPTMPRGPRLDAPGVLQHLMGRGIERRPIFRDDADRADFVARLAGRAQHGAGTVYAGAVLPNHAHLRVRTGTRPLSRSLRFLLTGYAGTFNRRHERTGHLFQNRYKSIVVEEEAYLRELVRYLHRNPLRAGVVSDRRRLGRARRAYREFVAAGLAQGRCPDLQGGGLVRSLGGWTAVAALRRGREAYAADERVLGAPAFVEQLRAEIAAQTSTPRRRPSLKDRLGAVAATEGLPPEALGGTGRSPRIARARAGVASLWCRLAGQSGRVLAATLGTSHQGVSAAATRGEREATRWQALGKIAVIANVPYDVPHDGHHYRTLSVPRDSVHLGPNVRTYLRACREIADAISESMRKTVAARPGAGFLGVARAATDLLAERLPITKAEDGLPLYGSVEAVYGNRQHLQ